MDFTAKERWGRLVDQFKFHTILFVMEPTNWKQPLKDWVVHLLQALMVLKPAGRELRFIGFSRGAWWGTEILRRLDPAGLDAVLLLAPYGCPGHKEPEGEEIGRLLARCGRGLMVASMSDHCNPWATWGPWLTGVHTQAPQRVTVVRDWSHDELRAGLVTGNPVTRDGAEDVFVQARSIFRI
jgi:hypothetical protein